MGIIEKGNIRERKLRLNSMRHWECQKMPKGEEKRKKRRENRDISLYDHSYHSYHSYHTPGMQGAAISTMPWA
jgi:hypothetical protein